MSSCNILFHQYSDETALKLRSRWNQQSSFWGNEKEFWRTSLMKDFKLTAADIENHENNYKELYNSLYQFKRDMAGTFFPQHTKEFVRKHGFHGTLLDLINGNVERFKTDLDKNAYTQAKLKELQIVAAYLGHINTVTEFGSKYNLKMDSDVLNMALLSGKVTGAELQSLAVNCKPTYESLRYAVRSGNVALLNHLMTDYNLKPSSDHFVVAAGIGNATMFDFLLNTGTYPEGDLVMDVALRSKSDAILSLLNASIAERINSGPGL